MNRELSLIEQSYYWTLNEGNKSYSWQTNYILDEKVDKDILKKAIIEANRYFPRYNTKPVVQKDGSILLCDNDNEIELYENNENRLFLGSKETNYYLHRVIVDDNKIGFVSSHMLGDGYAIFAYYQNVLYHYYRIKGEEPQITKKIYTKDDMVEGIYNQSLIDSVIKEYGNDEKEEKETLAKILSEKTEEQNNFNLQLDDSYFDKKYFSREKFSVNLAEFKEVLHKYNTTPLIFLFMIFAKALKEKYNIEHQNIAASYAVDMRKYFDSKSQFNFGTMSFLKIFSDTINEPIDKQIQSIKEYFEKGYDKKLLSTMCKIFARMTNISLYNINKYDDLMEQMNKEIEMTKGGVFISNIGYENYGEVINNHIMDIDFVSTPTKKDYEIHVLSIGNKCTFSLTLNGIDDGIYEKMAEIIKSFNISCEYDKKRQIENDHINPLLFDKK